MAHAAGLIFVAPDGAVLLLLRSPSEKNYANHWALPGGGGEDGETAMQTAIREAGEEIGTGNRHAWVGEPTLLEAVETPTGMTFSTFVQPTRFRFVPELNDEHSGYCWVMPDSLPTPIHPQVERVLEKFMAGSLAQDDASGKLNEHERSEADKTGKEREETMPSSAFLDPPDKYPVKEKRDGVWVYSRDLLLAAAREARMHDHEDLAKRADAIRNREFSGAHDSLTMDRDSVREFDRDSGHLHVKMTPISKATINPYYGREIPGWQTLRLDPEKVYQLYRDPEELAKGAPTFAGKPLSIVHKASSANDHPREVTVGSIGDKIEFNAPYLMAPLTVWDGEAIALIESGEQQELSCGYNYDPDMTPGVAEGKRYDGVMRNIRGNHVALVAEGRAGPDVLVQDQALKSAGHAGDKQEISMKTKLSLMAATANGALLTYLKPKLALDAKVDLTQVLAGITAENYKAKRPGMAEGVKKAVAGHLAKDAKIDDLGDVLLALDATLEANSALPAAGIKAKDKKARDEEPDHKERLRDFLKDKLSEDDMKACDDMMDDDDDEGALDEGEPEEERRKREAKEAAKDEDKDDKPTKAAMDSAINAAVSTTRKNVIAEVRGTERAIRQAERDVTPYVGNLDMTFDSAEEVYRHALTMLGVDDAKTIHVSALPTILKMQALPGARPVVFDKKTVGADASAKARATEIAPGFAHIKVGA